MAETARQHDVLRFAAVAGKEQISWESERRLSQHWPLSPEQMVGDHARSDKQT